MSLAFDGPTVFDAIRADHQLVEQLRRDRTSPPDCDPPSRRLVALLSAWQREIDADPFPAILLDEATAAARRGARELPPDDGATGSATSPRPGSASHQEAPVLDSPTGPIERVTVDFRKARPQLPDTSAYRAWINSPLTDDPEPNVLAVAVLLAVATVLAFALVAVVAL
jgi:hypothetical protein